MSRGGTISERSTLTSFRGQNTGASSFRGGATQPREPLGGRTTSHSHSSPPTSWYYGTYSYWPSYSYGPTYYSGFSWGFRSGFFGFGFHFPRYHFHPFHFGYFTPGVYYGSFSMAFRAGTAWHIVPYHHGWYGYNFGHRAHYYPWHHFRHHHRYHYGGLYFRVQRPYWYGYSRWYDYRPSGYSYTSVVYDSLYDDGYDDGYRRGYYDGADDASAYHDSRRRDQIGKKPRPRVPDSSIDRSRADAAEEFRYEMSRGTDSFKQGDFKASTRAFKEAMILAPENADARYSLAISAFAEGKHSFAAFALRRGIALEPGASDIDLEAVFRDPVVFNGFVENLNAELKADPEDPDLLLLGGYVALRTGEASEAAELLDRALLSAPQDAAAEYLQREAMKALEED